MKKLYVETNEPKTGTIKVENKYYEVVDTYEMAYALISNQIIKDGSADVSYYEDMYLEQNYSKEYAEAEDNGELGEFFDKMFGGVLEEEDYKNLLEMLDNIPAEFDPEEELTKLITAKDLRPNLFGDDSKVIAEYLENISQEDALAVVTYYYFYFGFGYEDQLISDIKDDQEDGVKFVHVERSETM